MAIYKSRKRESGNGMTGMMGTQRIRVGTRGMNVGMRGTRVGMRAMELGMRGIRVTLCENLRVYYFS